MFKALGFGILLWIATVFFLPPLAWSDGGGTQPLWLVQAPPHQMELAQATPDLTESPPTAPPLPAAEPDSETPIPQSDRPESLQPRSPDKANASVPQAAPRNPYDMDA